MKRDYSKFIDESYEQEDDFVTLMKHEIQKTIEEDSKKEAVENIMKLILETKYEW